MTTLPPPLLPASTPPEAVRHAFGSTAPAATSPQAVVWVADDGSPGAATAVPVAQTIARQLDAAVELFTDN
jgi:hypothetical protein